MTEAHYSGSLDDPRELAALLEQLGFGAAAAAGKAEMFARNASAVGTKDRRAYYVPGRIEVLGKHTDYAGGSTLVVAMERALCAVAAPRDDSLVRLSDTALGETTEFPIEKDLTPEVGHWSNYPMTVARRIARNFPGATRGADIAFSSDIPQAAGISSSSACIIAAFLALADVNDVWARPEFPAELHQPVNLSGYMGTIENGQTYGKLAGDRGVGTFGGSGDHTAILCSKTGHVSEYAYCPVRFRRTMPMPTGYVFVVASSGVISEKTRATLEKYNQASGLAGQVAEQWRRQTGRGDANIADALASGPDGKERLREIVASDLKLASRLEHFLTENEGVVPGACEALQAGDLPGFGALVDRSQKAAEELLGNQVPETAYLARTGREQGAVAASAFGAGFGGSVWALVEQTDADQFVDRWREGYQARFPDRSARSEFFVTAAGPPAFRML